MFNSTINSHEYEDNQRKEESNQIAIEISKENIAHVAENRILKEQNEIDEHIRNEYEKKVLDRNIMKDKSTESEKWNKQMEYREFLLKQIEDKEKNKKTQTSPGILGNAYTYSEELITPEMKKNLKFTKQQEIKNALDECIRMKNALKLENKQKELDEEKKRFELLKKREVDELTIREKVKQQSEIKEQRKQEVARTWTANKDEQREQFINALLKKDTTLLQLNNENTDQSLETEKKVELEDEFMIQPEEEHQEFMIQPEEEHQTSYLDYEKLIEDKNRNFY